MSRHLEALVQAEESLSLFLPSATVELEEPEEEPEELKVELSWELPLLGLLNMWIFLRRLQRLHCWGVSM